MITRLQIFCQRHKFYNRMRTNNAPFLSSVKKTKVYILIMSVLMILFSLLFVLLGQQLKSANILIYTAPNFEATTDKIMQITYMIYAIFKTSYCNLILSHEKQFQLHHTGFDLYSSSISSASGDYIYNRLIAIFMQVIYFMMLLVSLYYFLHNIDIDNIASFLINIVTFFILNILLSIFIIVISYLLYVSMYTKHDTINIEINDEYKKKSKVLTWQHSATTQFLCFTLFIISFALFLVCMFGVKFITDLIRQAYESFASIWYINLSVSAISLLIIMAILSL